VLIELEIHAVAGLASDSERSMVVLKEKNGERILPIMTSMRRALTLQMRKKLPFTIPVPLSVADVACLMMGKFGIHFSRIELVSINNGTFFCKIVAEREGEEEVVDYCLAPDALVLAVTANCPIMIEEELFEAQYMKKVGDHSFAINISTFSREMLEDALKHAVESENYEAASQLRDELAKRTPIDPS